MQIHHPKLESMRQKVGGFCADLWANSEQGRLLVLAGPNGTGKTHCARAVKRWVDKCGHGKQWVPKVDVIASLEALYWSWPNLLDRFKGGEWELLDDCRDTSCLIIDELGGGHDPSRVGIDKLCQILSKRENKFTMITTNVAPHSWEEIFDRRVASRFMRNSTLIDLAGVPDYSSLDQAPK